MLAPACASPRLVKAIGRTCKTWLSTDLYLAPKAPEGKAGNWLATVPGRGYFAILRLYGLTEMAINGSWKPGDIEKVN